MTKEKEPQTSLLEDLEDVVGQLQSDKVTEDQVVEILSNIVKYEKDKRKTTASRSPSPPGGGRRPIGGVFLETLPPAHGSLFLFSQARAEIGTGNQEPLQMGRWRNNTNAYFLGILDDFRVYLCV